MSIIKRMLLISLLFSLTVWADEGWQVKFNTQPEYAQTAYVLRGDGSQDVYLQVMCWSSDMSFIFMQDMKHGRSVWNRNKFVDITFVNQDTVSISITQGTFGGEAILWMGSHVMLRRSIEYMENEQAQRQVIKFLEQLYRTEPNQTLIFKLPGLDGEIITSEFSAKGAKNALLQFTEVCPGFALPVKLSTMPIPEAYQTEELDE